MMTAVDFPRGLTVRFWLDYLEGESREQRDERHAALQKISWEAVRDRIVLLGSRRYGQQTVHAFRTGPRGYGKRRHRWRDTTECGQMIESDWYWETLYGPLWGATCLSCLKTATERFGDHEIEDYFGDIADEMLGEIDVR